MDLKSKELHDGIEELDVGEGEPFTKLLAYISPWKGKAKVTKDPDSSKFMYSTPLLPDEVVFAGALLVHIIVLTLEDWDLINHAKFPHLATNKYMTKIYYEENGVTRLELMKWVKRVE